MKKFLTIATSLILFASIAAHAVTVSAVPVRVKYSDGAITESYFTTLYASTLKSIKGVVVAHSGVSPMHLAVGAEGSEVAQLLIPAGQSTAVFYPLAVSQAQRISLKNLESVGAHGTAIGEGSFSFIFH